MQRIFYPLVVAVGFLSVFAIYFAGLAYQRGAMDLGEAFGLLRNGAIAGITGTGLALFYTLVNRPRGFRLLLLLVSALLGLGAFYLPYRQQIIAQRLPAIHDISTDTANPPAFVDVLPLRAGAPNPAAYDGPEVAGQQRSAYPDIVPLSLTAAPETVFAESLALLRESGWTLVAAEQAEGRIEAVVTTRWFGFRDDVVLRIRPAPGGGTVFDMRSKSRVGRSDIGANAARIRTFTTSLKQRLQA